MSRHVHGGTRLVALAGVAALALLLAGCHLHVAGSSLLTVAPDGTVEVPVGCSHDTASCTGTVVVQLDGLDSEAQPFTVPPGGTDTVTVALTEQQYALVPADGYVPAEVRVDATAPAPARVHTVERGLRRAGPTTRRVSLAADGSEADDESHPGALSYDGRYLALQSKASNLVPGDTNRANDVFVHDTVTGVTSRVSVASDGSQANGGTSTGGPAISADGRHVAFLSQSTNLAAGATNGAPHVFVHDRVTGVTTHVSVATDGTQGDNQSYHPAISADGRYVAFRSLARNLVPGDTNNTSDAFVHDRITGETTRVSVSSTGAQANQEAEGSWSARPRISADGRQVAFVSYASNLVSGDTNGTYDVFVHDRVTGLTARVSVSGSGAQAIGQSGGPAMSADGRFVAFNSLASNLVPGDTNGTTDVFVHDRATGTTTLVSVATDGTQANRPSSQASISADGSIVVFETYASNLVAGDINDQTDVFVHDRATGDTSRASVAVDGTGGDDRSFTSTISGDGRHVAFSSIAANLVPGDANANGEYDVFVRHLG